MAVRINIRKLLSRFIYSLVLPMMLAILIDMQGGWFPWVTIAASVFFIPFSTVIVIRTALSEMDQLIQQVAPLEPVDGD